MMLNLSFFHSFSHFFLFIWGGYIKFSLSKFYICRLAEFYIHTHMYTQFSFTCEISQIQSVTNVSEM